MTLGLMFADPEAATVSTFPEMLQLVPDVPVSPLDTIVKFCAFTIELASKKTLNITLLIFILYFLKGVCNHYWQAELENKASAPELMVAFP